MIIAIILFAVFLLVVGVGIGCIFVWGAMCPPLSPPGSAGIPAGDVQDEHLAGKDASAPSQLEIS